MNTWCPNRSPECRDGKHAECPVKYWNLGIPCTCNCHGDLK